MNVTIVVGTSHSIQLRIDDALDTGGQKFEAFLKDLCQAHEVRAVAEEMSADALAERNCSTLVPKSLAETLSLKHRYCDPCRSERAKRGILQENDIRAEAFLSGWSESEIAVRIVESNARREQYWLDQLWELNTWPVLFVCGANHVAQLCSLSIRP